MMKIMELQAINGALTSMENLNKFIVLNEKHFTNTDCIQAYQIVEEIYNAGKTAEMSTFSARYIDRYSEEEFNRLYGKMLELPVLTPGGYQEVINGLRKEVVKKDVALRLKDMYGKVSKGDIDIEALANEVIEITSTYEVAENNGINVKDIPEQDFDDFFSGQFYPTTFHPLDNIIQGYFECQLYTIAARPGVGKSLSILQQACEMSLQGVKSMIFSLEMTRNEIVARRIQQKTKVPSWKIETRKLSKEERRRAEEEYRKLSNVDLVVYDDIFELDRICAIIIQHALKNNVNVVFIDYLQLISGAQGFNRNEQVGNITRALKMVAQKYNLAIVALSQMSRGIEKENRKPVLSDLRDSGAIEQDSGIVIFIHMGEDDQGQEFYEWIIAKNRKGRTGSITSIYLDRDYIRFDFPGSVPGEREFNETTQYIHN
jgi:replicative DNA helicase